MHSKRAQISSSDGRLKTSRSSIEDRLSRKDSHSNSIKSRLGGFVKGRSPVEESPPVKLKRTEVVWSDDDAKTPAKKKNSENVRATTRNLAAPSETANNLLTSIADSFSPSLISNDKLKSRLSSEALRPRQDEIPKPAPSGKLERYMHDIDSQTSLTSGLIDTHMHIDFTQSMFNATDLKWSDFCKRFAARFPACYEGSIASFCNPATFACSNPLLNEAFASDRLWLSFGVHPHFADQFCEEKLRACLHKYKKRVVALGEIGLDTSTKNQVSLEVQKETFRLQAEIGIECGLPLVIHTRVSNDNDETLKFMRKFVPRDYRLHRHCFTGGWNEANDWLLHFSNCYIGFTPLINNQPELMKIAARVPFDRILLETDAPYFKTGLPPLEIGGRTVGTVPGDVIYTAVGIAKARNVPLEAVICQTRLNVKQLYGI